MIHTMIVVQQISPVSLMSFEAKQSSSPSAIFPARRDLHTVLCLTTFRDRLRSQSFRKGEGSSAGGLDCVTNNTSDGGGCFYLLPYTLIIGILPMYL